MKRSHGLFVFLFIVSIISGYLMSKASLVGKAGMSLFYREYNFLKTWWKGALLILGTMILLYFLHYMITKKFDLKNQKNFHRVFCLLAIVGLYFTYDDFRHTLSHHLLGERFHIGVYLFWIGWVTIAIYFLTDPSRNPTDVPLEDTSSNAKLQG